VAWQFPDDQGRDNDATPFAAISVLPGHSHRQHVPSEAHRTSCYLPNGEHRGSLRTVVEIAENKMNITLSAGPLAALIAGILILIVPRLLNYIVALYLILIGVLGLFGAYASHVV
jgi:Protein of unknown function (DUF3096)